MSRTINDGSFIGGNDLRSFLMIGQSNMAGRGNIGEVSEIDNFRCYMLRNGRFLRMREPINPDRPIFYGADRSGISLAASFADEFANSYAARVGLIPCADGGTPMDLWHKGGILFDHAVMMTRLAMRTSSFSGFLWHHGESDCLSRESLEAYKPKLVKFICDIRAALDAERLPFIMGEISRDVSLEWFDPSRAEEMNEIISEVARELPNVAVASSRGLALKPDGVHFDSESLRIFGKRYFEEYKKIKGEKL